MRLFLAVELKKNIQETLSASILRLKENYPSFNWVENGNYHITLYFFGKTERLSMIKKHLDRILWQKKRFYLYPKSLGIFVGKKIVIYLDFYREKKIELMTYELKNFFDPFFAKEKMVKKKYIPHITLARARLPSKQQYFLLKKNLQAHPMDQLSPIEVSTLTLFESILEGKKPVYRPIKSYILEK